MPYFPKKPQLKMACHLFSAYNTYPSLVSSPLTWIRVWQYLLFQPNTLLGGVHVPPCHAALAHHLRVNHWQHLPALAGGVWGDNQLLAVRHGQAQTGTHAHHSRYGGEHGGQGQVCTDLYPGIMALGVVFDMAVVYYAKDLQIFDVDEKPKINQTRL